MAANKKSKTAPSRYYKDHLIIVDVSDLALVSREGTYVLVLYDYGYQERKPLRVEYAETVDRDKAYDTIYQQMTQLEQAKRRRV